MQYFKRIKFYGRYIKSLKMLKTFKHIKNSKLKENKSNFSKAIHFDEIHTNEKQHWQCWTSHQVGKVSGVGWRYFKFLRGTILALNPNTSKIYINKIYIK